MVPRDDLRQQLTAELDTLLKRQDRLDAHLQNRSQDLPQDWDDRALAQENDEVVEALDERTRHRIHQLRHALARMDDPDWGVCEGCGDAIPPKRLMILPATTHCVGCAEAAER
ncbi:MAG: TraR/DksA family transcriptional regulator [Myxococcales bacterium]|nr:TraR/DksA family transcriptional regulator [Myxococcales bacterium]